MPLRRRASVRATGPLGLRHECAARAVPIQVTVGTEAPGRLLRVSSSAW